MRRLRRRQHVRVQTRCVVNCNRVSKVTVTNDDHSWDHHRCRWDQLKLSNQSVFKCGSHGGRYIQLSGQATETRLVVRVLYWGQFTFIYGHHMGTSQTYVLHFDYIMRVKMVYGGRARIVLGLQEIPFIRTLFSSSRSQLCTICSFF